MMIWDFLGSLGDMQLVIFCFLILPISLVLIGSFLGKKIFQVQKLGIDDFKKNQDYYREFIKSYSPALLSYIDDLKLDLPRDIIGTLMILEEKGYLIVNNGIFLNETKDLNDSNLTEIEKYVLQNIENGRFNADAEEVKKIVSKEGLDKKVLQKNMNIPLPPFALIVILMVPYMLEDFGVDNLFVEILLAISGITIFFGILIGFFYFASAIQNPFYRTEKGKEINQKIEGLKRFLNDYSDLKSKEAEMIKLWDDYLIYSIIFHQNNVAMSKYMKYIKVENLNNEIK